MEKKKRERFAGKRELILLEEWLNLLAARERAAGHMHTAYNYESALSSVQKYLGADA